MAKLPVRMYLVGQLSKFFDIATTCLLTTQSGGESLEHFAYFTSLQQVVCAQFTYEDTKVIDGTNKSRDLQFEQRFAHDALCDPELLSQFLLGKPFPGLALPGEDHFLDPAAHAVSC